MRLLMAVLFILSSAIVAAACTADLNDCAKNPNLDCYPGGAGTTSTTGGGGTGGGPECQVASDCGTDLQCKKYTCVASKCGTYQEQDGTKCGANDLLECKGGVCTGCQEATDCGDAAPCHKVECQGGQCMEPPDGTLTCGPGGTGTCDDAGNCGVCDDGKQNGDEDGVDCGAATACGGCPGQFCDGSTKCKDGFCVDSVCCNVPCDGKCEACTEALTGMPTGTCAPLKFGTEEDPGSPECQGKGGCGAVAGFCACEDGEKNGDETDVDCGGSCGATCTRGQVCTAAADCGGDGQTYCVDGVCCASVCDTACRSCNQPELEGLCTAFAGDDAAGMCTGNNQCGADSCETANDEMCGANGECASGVCAGSPKKKCVACGAGNMCPNGKACINGVCFTTMLAVGESCINGSLCMSGFCVDGVCCDTACDGLCMACHYNYTGANGGSGTCAAMLAGYDPHDECTGPGKAATCSGQSPDANGDSSCGTN